MCLIPNLNLKPARGKYRYKFLEKISCFAPLLLSPSCSQTWELGKWNKKLRKTGNKNGQGFHVYCNKKLCEKAVQEMSGTIIKSCLIKSTKEN